MNGTIQLSSLFLTVVSLLGFCLSTEQRVLALVLLPQPAGLSQKTITALAQKRFLREGDDESPMKGKVAVVTGAAGGIGGELCRVLHSLGGTVVALDRDANGLADLRTSLLRDGDDDRGGAEGDEDDDDGGGRVWTVTTHHEDLRSVADAAERIKSRYPKIDILINNAGLGYPRELVPGRSPGMVSAHGKDLAFTVNYLSHFLLTEKLLDRLSAADPQRGGRVVHLTSTFHWKVDGRELLPGPDGADPIALRADPRTQGPKHVERSYANTKLAQLWHSRSIARAAAAANLHCSSVCACPTWAATGIAGKAGEDFLLRYAFPVAQRGPGITSALNAVLRTDEELGAALDDGDCLVANSRILEYLKGIDAWLTSDATMHTFRMRDVLADVLAGVLLLGQRYTYNDFIVQRTSPESFNDQEKRDRFYQWSRKEVEQWL